jgi:hypothetical protein
MSLNDVYMKFRINVNSGLGAFYCPFQNTLDTRLMVRLGLELRNQLFEEVLDG